MIQDPEAGSTAVNGLLTAAADGVAGLVDDFLVCSRRWGFRLEEVKVPVHLWHGLQDNLVPAEHAWQLVSSLPNCRPAFDADEGHFFFRRRVNEIVTQLVDAARPDGRADAVPRGASGIPSGRRASAPPPSQ